MMSKADEYRRKRELRQQRNRARAARLARWLPVLEAMCSKYGIKMLAISGGHQFRVNEYILNWWPAANKIVVQYVGEKDSIPFELNEPSTQPKIIVALEKLIRVTRGAKLSESRASAPS